MNYAEPLLPIIRSNFERDGEIVPVAFVFITKNPSSGETLSEPTGIIVPPSSSKDQFASMVRILCIKGEAKAVVIVSEMWRADSEAAAKWYEDHGTLEGCPDASEQVMVSEEHQGSYVAWTSKITRDKNGKPSLGDFEFTNMGKAQTVGRFVGFLNAQA